MLSSEMEYVIINLARAQARRASLVLDEPAPEQLQRLAVRLLLGSHGNVVVAARPPHLGQQPVLSQPPLQPPEEGSPRPRPLNHGPGRQSKVLGYRTSTRDVFW